MKSAKLAILLAVGLLAPEVRANSGITVESANDYTVICGDHSCDTACNSEGDGFWNGMVGGGTGWTPWVHYKDFSVWDTDFYDPNRPGSLAQDNDTYNFDKTGNAISFVCLHGTCDDCTTTNCNSGANCPGGECMNNPPSAYSSRCASPTPRRLVTSSTTSSHNNIVWYGNNTVKWGEDANSGTWAGAGTNGGTNLVVMINSCGLRPYYWGQLSPAFGGVHLIASIMPVSNVAKPGGGCADAANYEWRGSSLAGYALINPLGSVTLAWFSLLDGTPQAGYMSCPDLSATFTHGGGRGINGCGAHNVLSYDATQALANWHVDTESWAGVKNEGNDATGAGYGRWAAHCNYDCNTYNFTK